MSSDAKFIEYQYLGYNKLSFVRRTALALFCFFAYYLSENSEEAVGSGSMFFILGISIVVISALLIFVLHFKTIVQDNGIIVLEGIWTSRKVKIDMASIVEVKKVKYNRFFFNRSVYNLHRKGSIHFYTRGKNCVELTDKDGSKYLIGSQRASELNRVLNKKLNK